MSGDYSILDNISLPKDLKNLSYSELEQLCTELREIIVSTIAENGGHLASSLGVVELAVVINLIFNRPADKVIWDVGHQCYADKILTGRLKNIKTIRKPSGLSGFPKTQESPYDSFNVGHSSTSISAALGIAYSNSIQCDDNKVVAVIGDGAFSGGLAFEGLNNAGRFKKNFIIILNDNKMSISKNVGSMAKYLSKIRTNGAYLKAKNKLSFALEKTPVIGQYVENGLVTVKGKFKKLLYSVNIFEDLGFIYYGPVDGHNILELQKALKAAYNSNKPVVVHVVTKKGKGYSFAEKNPKAFHGISHFDIKTGKSYSLGENFSSIFGDNVCKLAKKNSKICAITAAMATGTGLKKFASSYKDRFFDVGIAEEHAVTFSAGLSISGLIPIFSVYSTFFQRCYDQIIHDVALQNTKVIFAIDRAGIVGEDGETHQGMFDVSMLNTVPGAVIYSPSYFCELKRDLELAVENDIKSVVAVRYPRGGEWYKPNYYKMTDKSFDIYFDGEILIITYGRMFSKVCEAVEQLQEYGFHIKIIKLNILKPLEITLIDEIINSNYIFFFEESILSGGVAQVLGLKLLEKHFKGFYYPVAVTETFVQQNSVEGALKLYGLDTVSIKNKILEECKGCLKLKKDLIAFW